MDNQTKNTKLYVLIAILFVLVLALVSYIIYDKTQNKTPVETPTTDKTNTDEDSDALVSKIDDTKDWIYDAEYTKNVTAESYKTSSKTYYSKDIVVPYINIKSSYVESSNNEIKSIFEDAIKTYNLGVNDKTTYIDECNYQKYNDNDVLSVLLTYGVGATDVVHPKYYTYNIDLKTGKELTYEEVYNIAGFTSTNITSKVENAITKVMQENMSNFSSENYPNGTNFDTYNNESINNYKNSISNNTLKYFLTDNGQLNIVVKLSIPAGTGEFDTVITVD